jgi:hypothetical protein
MVRMKARFDGQVLIPEEPVQLPQGVSLSVTVETDDAAGGSNPILSLSGLGKELWAGIDPVEYQRSERKGWE